MTGSDWRQYEKDFSLMGQGLPIRYESGFIFLNQFFYNLGVGFWPFIIFLKSFSLTILVALGNKLKGFFWLGFALFVANEGLFLFIDNPLRNLVAASFIWLGAIFLADKKYFFFTSCLFLALQFHLSVFVCIPFIIFSRVSFSRSFLILLTLSFFILFSSQNLILNSALLLQESFQISHVPKYFFDTNSKYIAGSFFSAGLLIRCFFWLLIIWQGKGLQSEIPAGSIFLSLSCGYLIAVRIGTTVPILERIAMVFSPFFWFSFAYSLKLIRKSIRNVLVFFLFLFSIVVIYREISSSHKYVPYSNYFFHLMISDELPFSYRNEFNLRESPFSGARK